MNNPYAVLGLSPDCTDKQLKKAMRRLSKRWHPDMNPGQEAFAQRKFRDVQEAYEEILRERMTGRRVLYKESEKREPSYPRTQRKSGHRWEWEENGSWKGFDWVSSDIMSAELFAPFKEVEYCLKEGKAEKARKLLEDESLFEAGTPVWNYYMAVSFIENEPTLAYHYARMAMEADPNVARFMALYQFLNTNENRERESRIEDDGFDLGSIFLAAVMVALIILLYTVR